MPELAAHIPLVPGSGIRRIFELASELDTADEPVTWLAIGEPDVALAPHIAEAAAAAWRRDDTNYEANGGIPQLRSAIVAKLARENDIHVAIEQIWVTVGGTQALHTAMQLVLGAGDEILVPDPGYTVFTMGPRMMGAVPVAYPLRPDREFRPAIDELDALVTDRTRAIIVNSPSNPLGAVFPADVIAELYEFAQRHDLWIIADEVYERFTWDGAHTALGASDPDHRVLSVFSLSKTYAMTGIRVGWLVTPPGLTATMRSMQEATISCVATPDQWAALAALEGDQSHVTDAFEHYRRNLDLATTALDERGVRYLRPSGAFYLWVDVSDRTDGDVAAWAERLLLRERVAVAPGSAFGRMGEGWIRLCVAASREDLLRGIAAL